MITYARRTLEDFSQPISEEEAHKLQDSALRRRPFCDNRPLQRQIAPLLQAELAVPLDLLLEVIPYDGLAEPAKLSEHLSMWLDTASERERIVEICDALLARTESATSNSLWSRDFAAEIARVFDAPSDLGLQTIETPGIPGRRWGRLVAEATADRLLSLVR